MMIYTFSLKQGQVHYFNQLYSSLIRDDDPYVLNLFRPVSKELQHSEVCCLLSIFKYFQMISDLLDEINEYDWRNREALIASIEKLYRENVKLQLQFMMMKALLMEHFKRGC